MTSNQPAGYYGFKVANADWSEYWPPVNIVDANAKAAVEFADEVIYFRLDLNPRPGWQPETGAVMTDHAVPSGTQIELIGAAPELGEWNAGVPATLNGNVWSAVVTIATPGTYGYKFRSVGSWDWGFGVHYNMEGGGDFTVTTNRADQQVTFELDMADGRSRAAPAEVPVAPTTWGRIKSAVAGS